MAGVNKATLIGNLGRDPILRYTASGIPVCNFSVATNEDFKDAKGKLQRQTEWHQIVTWNRQAETCAQYLTKGRQVYVEDKIKSRTYTDKSEIEHTVSEIHAFRVQFLGANPSPQPEQAGVSNQEPPPSDPDEDIPF